MDAATLQEIYNYRLLDARLATGGQPTASELAAVAAGGFQVVINLATFDPAHSLPDERATVESAGMIYEHIPVVWEQPVDDDLASFCAAMDRHQDRPVFVHCIANKRVSAFVFLYRILRLGRRPADALPDLHAIWQPNPTWQAFIDAHLA